MKVLIISHLPVATQNNMGKTFLSLFSQFDREEICQLYIYPAIPNVDRCSSYYRVTDKDVLAWFLGKRNIGGEIDRGLIRADQGLYERESDEGLYRNRKNKSPVRRLLRDAMWMLAPWYGKRLKAWLEREKPDCIFVAPGAAKFLYDMALIIAKDRKTPVVSYVCDEYYFVNTPDSLLDRMRLKLLQRKIRKLMTESCHLVVISEELKRAYAETFGVETSVVMTGAQCSIAETPVVLEAPAEISYFGNIRCNRYVVLAEIGRELDAINRELGSSFRLKIYTSEKDPQILGEFADIESVKLCGFVTGQAYEQAFHNAQLLLHVEAFDESSVDFTKHSVSTKIADSLASGIPLVAYGPAEISSMQHLLRNEAALAATSREELRPMLMKAFGDPAERQKAARNGLETAKKYHDSRISGQKMRKILETIREP